MKQQVLIITHELIAAQMAGPAIRCWELARQISTVCEVTLTSKLPVSRSGAGFAVRSFHDDWRLLHDLAKNADILIVQGLMLRQFPQLARLGKYLVVDLYDPFIFESYPHLLSLGPKRDETFLEYIDILDEQMVLGDYFICASERQRDMWLGRFCALGRLTPELFAEDPSMSRLLGLVPFGLPDEPPVASETLLRGVTPGIESGDFILLWGGGVWNWFDPLSVIQAVAELGKERSDIKLYFMGIKHPNPEIPEMEMANRAVALADELGVTGRLVFFNHGWVPYGERQAYLKEANAGVSAHFESLETRFSFRTRVLDYFWAGLPVISTVGDGMAELVEKEGLGETVGYQSVEDWKRAIVALADDPERTKAISARISHFAERYQWSEVAKPLIAYCLAPYRTPRSLKNHPYPAKKHWGRVIKHGLQVLRREGPTSLFRKGIRFLKKQRR